MTSFAKKAYWKAFGIPLHKAKLQAQKVQLQMNRAGSKVQCYVCKNKMDHFTPFRRGRIDIPEFLWKLDLIGSDVDNFWCVHCNAQDRERHLYMFFDRLGKWDKIKGANVLHFAPERHLSKSIQELGPAQYVMGDLYPADPKVQKIDVTDIPYPENHFNLVLCNHVLEHVPDYNKAMREIFRVLKPGGSAILQTPYSTVLKKNFEDDGINTDALRFYFYAQEDHVRLFSEEVFLRDLKGAGFELHIAKHQDFFDEDSARYYGVNPKEDLIRVTKPSH
jgi:SAM-dependent methyltransferase